jgi:hypothetical protein
MSSSTRLDKAALTGILVSQYQVISRRQALASGLTPSALHHRLRADGPWQPLLPGVFLAATGTPTSDQRCVAAMLYGGAGSQLTGTAALRFWSIRAPYTASVDLLIPAARRRKSTGFVRVHPTIRMPDQAVAVGPLRLAPIPRAVADAARGLAKLADVRALIAAVVQQGTCTPDLLAAELQAGPVQGSALLRTAIADVCGGIRSRPEADLKDLVRRGKLPEPLFNPDLYRGDEFIARPDAWWKDAGVAAEVDSHEYHLSPHDHERTLDRDARMAAHGITVLHFTPRQIRTQPARVIATIRSALTAARSRPTLPIRTIASSLTTTADSARRTETPVS